MIFSLRISLRKQSSVSYFPITKPTNIPHVSPLLPHAAFPTVTMHQPSFPMTNPSRRILFPSDLFMDFEPQLSPLSPTSSNSLATGSFPLVLQTCYNISLKRNPDLISTSSHYTISVPFNSKIPSKSYS